MILEQAGDGFMSDVRFESNINSDWEEKNVPCKIKLQEREGSNLKSYVKRNWHKNMELMYFVQGSGQVFCGTQTFDVSEGDLFIVNAYLPHEVVSEKAINFYYIKVSDWFCEVNELDTDQVYFNELITDPYAKELFLEVVKEYTGELLYKNAGIRMALLRLLVYLFRNHVVPMDGNRRGVSAKEASIQFALGYIISHVDEKISVDQIAEKVGLSRYYFMREFKKATGETLMSYIQKIRCENAKKMLESERYTLREISEQCGFEEFSYFCTSFKKYTGMTPTNYRLSAKEHNF